MSRIKAIFKKASWPQIVSQLMVMVLLAFGGSMLMGAAGLGLSHLIWGEAATSGQSPDAMRAVSVHSTKLIQAFTVIGSFLFPAIAFPMVYRVPPKAYLGIEKGGKPLVFFWVLLLLVCLNPVMDLVIDWNRNVELPDYLAGIESWMRNSEERLEKLTMRLLEMEHFGDFLVNVLVIAVVAAVAEEFFFRGLLQKSIYLWSLNAHLAIWVAAIIFSAIHMQFFGFFPRMILGALFGYLFYWSGSLWIAVYAHFLNNFAGVSLAYLHQKGITEMNINESVNYPNGVTIVALLFSIGLVYLIKKITESKDKDAEEGSQNDLDAPKRDWEVVFKTQDVHLAEILVGHLKSEGLDAVLMNKKDSAYQTFGDAYIYVPKSEKERAEETLDKIQNENE